MRGYIRKASNGSWQIEIYTGQMKDGKRQRIFETVRGRKSDAQNKCNDLLVELQKGNYAAAGRRTVAEHLSNWLESYVKTNCSQRTLEGYQSIVAHHLIPELGDIKLKHLRPQSIQSYYSKAIEKLSAVSVHHHHRVLSEALKYAVRQGYLAHNPAEMVDPPSPRKNPMRTLTATEVEILLTSVRDSGYYPIIYTAISTGLRQAEILGLRWRDIDLDMNSISVSQVLYIRKGKVQFKEPKTPHSRRRVSMTPKLAIFLKLYRIQRERYYLQLGEPLTLDTLVFTTIEGKPIDAHILSRAFGRLAQKAGLGHVRFHDLRHTFATLMFLHGAKPKVISEALGHASVGFTMDVYSHIIEGMQQDAMALLDEVLPDAINSEQNETNAKLTLNPDDKVDKH
jgi:integrase